MNVFDVTCINEGKKSQNEFLICKDSLCFQPLRKKQQFQLTTGKMQNAASQCHLEEHWFRLILISM